MSPRRRVSLLAAPAVAAPALVALCSAATPALATVPYAPAHARPLPAALTTPLTCYVTFRDYAPNGRAQPWQTEPQASLQLYDNHYDASGEQIDPKGAQAGAGYLRDRTYHFVNGPLNTAHFRVVGHYHAGGVPMPHSRLRQRHRRFALVITAQNPHGKVSNTPGFSFAPFETWYCGSR